jgi:D-inositol-3-phosphate glycosyltransferase
LGGGAKIMNILEIAGSGTIGTSEMGPVSTDICELSNHFVQLGHEVTVADSYSQLERKHLVDGVKLVEIDAVPRATFRTKFSNKYERAVQMWWNEYIFIKGLIEQLHTKDYDVVHIHEWIPALILRTLFRIDYVYTSHTPIWCLKHLEVRGSQHSTCRTNKLRVANERRVIEDSVLTIALGGYLKLCVPRANIAVVPNGVDIDTFCPADKALARMELGFEHTDFIAVCVARVNPVKGLDVLVEAVRELRSAIPNLKVEVIGSLGTSFNERDSVSTYAKSLIDRAKNLPINFAGFISNQSPMFRNYISSADVFILPSRYEPQGKVVLEALAMGKPVIGSAAGGIPDMLNERVGFVFPPGDSRALADTIRECYEKLPLISGESCREHVRNNFTWRRVAERHLDSFSRLP